MNGAMKDLGRKVMTIGTWKQTTIYWGLNLLPTLLLDMFMKHTQEEQLNIHREQRKTNLG